VVNEGVKRLFVRKMIYPQPT